MSNLPPLPEPAGWAPVLGSQNIFTAEQLLAFAEEAVRLEREACAMMFEDLEDVAAAIRARSQEGQG